MVPSVKTERVLSSVEAFESDVLNCGVPADEVRRLGDRYTRALETGGYLEWIELYVGTFATLLQRSNSTKSADRGASQRLMRLIDDDLGSKIFDRDARAELMLALDRGAVFDHYGRACQHA